MSALRNNSFLILSLVGALALRLIYLWESSASPFFDAPIVDAQTFLRQAQAIAGGDLSGGDEPFWQPPLYIYLLAFVCWLFPSDYFVAMRLVHIALGTASCGLLYSIANRCFGIDTARIATVIAALCGSSIFFEGELLAVPLEMFLNLALLHQLITAVDRPTASRWTVAGLLAGLAALTRPTILLFVAAFLVWRVFASLREKNSFWNSSLRPLMLLGALALTILPVTVRNYVMEPDLVLISSNGGINFYIGNSGQYEEKVSIHPGMRWEEMATEPIRAGHTTAAAKSAYFFSKSVQYITEYPVYYLQTLAYKCWLFFSGPEIKRNIDIYHARQYSYVLSTLLWDYGLSFPFGLLSPLSLIGLYVTWRDRTEGVSIVRLYALAYVLSVVLFFVAARYRMPVLPILTLFASVGGLSIYSRIQQDRWRAGSIVGLFAALVLVFNLRTAPDPALDAQLQFDLGEVQLRKGFYEQAAAHAQQALRLEPTYNYARHNLAVALFNMDDINRAIIEGEHTAHENPQRADTHALLGRAYAKRGDRARADQSFQRALALDPDNGIAHYYYGRFLYANRRYIQASEQFKKARNWKGADATIHYDLGRALHGSGDVSGALRAYGEAWSIGHLPEAANAVGAVHLMNGHLDQTRIFFTYALERDPDNVEALVNLGLLDVREGRVQDGLKQLRALLSQHPESTIVRRALESVQPRKMP